MKRNVWMAVAMFASFLLVSVCRGGDGDAPASRPPSVAQGLWTGSTASKRALAGMDFHLEPETPSTLPATMSAGFVATKSCEGTITHGNACDIALSLGDAPCPTPKLRGAGIAYFDAAAQKLYMAAPNAARTDGVLFLGPKL